MRGAAVMSGGVACCRRLPDYHVGNEPLEARAPEGQQMGPALGGQKQPSHARLDPSAMPSPPPPSFGGRGSWRRRAVGSPRKRKGEGCTAWKGRVRVACTMHVACAALRQCGECQPAPCRAARVHARPLPLVPEATPGLLGRRRLCGARRWLHGLARLADYMAQCVCVWLCGRGCLRVVSAFTQKCSDRKRY